VASVHGIEIISEYDRSGSYSVLGFRYSVLDNPS
jgi:hypothetical protein